MGPKKRGRPRIERPLPVDHEGDALHASPIDGLFTATQRRLLRFLFGQPDREFCVRELRDLAGCGAGATQRELFRLATAGLVSVAPDGNRMCVQANASSPIHDELAAMVRKTIGVVEPLREALSAVTPAISFAFAFEPHRDPYALPRWDIGVVLVSPRLDALGEGLAIARHLAEHLLRRGVWFVARTPQAFDTDEYITQLLRRPRVWVIGSEQKASRRALASAPRAAHGFVELA